MGKVVLKILLSYLALKFNLVQLPKSIKINKFLFVSFLIGIGFTLSIFTSNNAYADIFIFVQAKAAVLAHFY